MEPEPAPTMAPSTARLALESATSLDERIEWHRSAVERDEWLMRPDERRLMATLKAAKANHPS